MKNQLLVTVDPKCIDTLYKTMRNTFGKLSVKISFKNKKTMIISIVGTKHTQSSLTEWISKIYSDFFVVEKGITEEE